MQLPFQHLPEHRMIGGLWHLYCACPLGMWVPNKSTESHIRETQQTPGVLRTLFYDLCSATGSPCPASMQNCWQKQWIQTHRKAHEAAGPAWNLPIQTATPRNRHSALLMVSDLFHHSCPPARSPWVCVPARPSRVHTLTARVQMRAGLLPWGFWRSVPDTRVKSSSKY